MGLQGEILYLLEGAKFTILYSAIAILLSTFFGFIFGIFAAVGNKWIRLIISSIVILTRAVPVLIYLFLMYFFLPTVGIYINISSAIIIGLTVYFTMYIIETVRGAILSVPSGQTEAGKSLGISKIKIITLILIPQAIVFAIPPLMNNWTTLVKATSYGSIIGLFELTQASRIIVERSYDIFKIFGISMIIYFVICYSLVRIGKRYERKLSYKI